MVFLPLFAVYFAPSVIGGIGLLFDARWARWLLLVQAVAYLFLMPLGAALGVTTLLVLLTRQPFRGRAPTLPASAAAAAPPGIIQILRARWNQPLGSAGGIIAAMAIVGPGFIVVIDLLFHYNEPHTPPELDQAFAIALPIVLIASVILARSLYLSRGAVADWRTPSYFYFRSRRFARQSRNWSAQEQRRIARLRADPALRKYARLMDTGQHWSDEQIAYDRAPTRLDSCEHLQSIERAMRAAGITIRPNYNQYLAADCAIDYPELQRRFLDVREPVFYTDAIPGDRPYDPESAAIFCREHSSAIYVTHPDDAKPDTPWFPGLER